MGEVHLHGSLLLDLAAISDVAGQNSRSEFLAPPPALNGLEGGQDALVGPSDQLSVGPHTQTGGPLEDLLRAQAELVALAEDEPVALGERMQGLAAYSHRLPVDSDLLGTYGARVRQGTYFAQLYLGMSAPALVDHHSPGGTLHEVHHLRLGEAAGHRVDVAHDLL
jgi:hypothetical protein